MEHVNYKSRGWRNNNPCNIEKGAKWLGLDPQGQDKRFCTFTSLTYGFRAAFIIVCKSYYGKHYVTLEQIISRWAPQKENNTKAYIDMVSRQTGIGRYTLLPRPSQLTANVWIPIVKAMAIHENGYWKREADEQIEKAFKMVFPAPTVQTIPDEDNTFGY